MTPHRVTKSAAGSDDNSRMHLWVDAAKALGVRSSFGVGALLIVVTTLVEKVLTILIESVATRVSVTSILMVLAGTVVLAPFLARRLTEATDAELEQVRDDQKKTEVKLNAQLEAKDAELEQVRDDQKKTEVELNARLEAKDAELEQVRDDQKKTEVELNARLEAKDAELKQVRDDHENTKALARDARKQLDHIPAPQ